MIQTKVTRLLAPTGFAPAGKPDNADRQPRTTGRCPQCSGLLWLACAVAAIGMAASQTQRSWPMEAYSFAASIRDSADNFYRVAGGGMAGFGVDPGGVS
jgi:hypothetical protein